MNRISRAIKSFVTGVACLAVLGANVAYAANSTLSNLPAASSVGSTDLFYDVQGGSDYKVTAAQIASLVGTIPATGNITEYVATTGSDTNNNCQNSGSKCLTIQHAVNQAALYNYEGVYALTINVADGTYAVNGTAPAVTLLPLTNYPAGARPSLSGDTSTPANAIISNTGGDSVATANAAYWNMQGFRLKSTSGANCDLNSQNGSNVGLTGAMDFAGNGDNMCANGYSGISAFLQAINFSTTSAVTAFYGFAGGYVIVDGSTITFPSGGATYSGPVLSLSDQSVFGNPTFVNAADVTGTKFSIYNNSYCEYTGTRTSFPGNVAGALGSFSYFNGDDGVGLYDANAHLWGDYNISGSGLWTLSSVNGLNVTSSGTGKGVQLNGAQPGLYLNDTETNGALFEIFAQVNGTTPYYGFYNVSARSFAGITYMALGYDGANGLQVTEGAAIGWAANANYADLAAMDTALSRVSANVVGIGNGTPGNVSGTLNAAHATLNALVNSATTSAVCYNTSTGVLTYGGTVGTCTTSDERLKNIGPRIDDALGKLLSINGFYYTWKDPAQYGSGRQIGIGAQTVEKVFPELVQTGSDGLKSVDYVHMVAPIIEAMRELKADNDNLKACQNNWRCRLFGMR